MWRRRSWFSLNGKAGIPGQTEGRPATSIEPRVPPVGSLQQRVRRCSLGSWTPPRVTCNTTTLARWCRRGRPHHQALSVRTASSARSRVGDPWSASRCEVLLRCPALWLSIRVVPVGWRSPERFLSPLGTIGSTFNLFFTFLTGSLAGLGRGWPDAHLGG
jgi:hypothetical protein